jgi:nucleotide-binding universal stress UspA family protein
MVCDQVRWPTPPHPLLAKENIMFPIRTILHPTDLSERSAPAFQLACTLAREQDARVLVLHVVRPPSVLLVEGVLTPPPQGSLDELRQQPGSASRMKHSTPRRTGSSVPPGGPPRS